MAKVRKVKRKAKRKAAKAVFSRIRIDAMGKRQLMAVWYDYTRKVTRADAVFILDDHYVKDPLKLLRTIGAYAANRAAILWSTTKQAKDCYRAICNKLARDIAMGSAHAYRRLIAKETE